MNTDHQRSFKVTLEYSPVYELVISLRVYLNKKDRKVLDLGQDWVEQVNQQLSPQFKEELERAQAFLSQLQIDLLLVYFSPEKESISGFLEWLGNIDIQSFEGTIHSFLPDSDERTSLYKEILKYQADVNTATASIGEEHSLHLDSLIERSLPILTFLRDRLFSFWRGWYEEYFSSVEEDITVQLKQNILEKNDWLGHMTAIDIFERSTNGMYLEDTFEDPVILIPQYHSSPFNIYLNLDIRGERINVYFYPIDLVSATEDEPSAKLLRVVRCISDLNRLKILRFLYRKQKSFTEIVRFVGLAKSTVHHHMVVLRAAGLVRVYLSETQGTRYSLRESRIREISNLLNEFVTNDSVSK